MIHTLDKIKAFLIESLQRKGQITLFANYFSRMEENYAKAGLADELQSFLLDYLSIYSNGKIINDNDIYTYFRDFYLFASRLKTDENILKHLYRYSCYYLKIVTEDISDKDIKKSVAKINELKAYDTYPYLLEVFEDYEFSIINKLMFTDILETVVEYAANRKFSADETISFAVLSRELNKMLAVKTYVPQFENVNSYKSSASVTINELMKQY